MILLNLLSKIKQYIYNLRNPIVFDLEENYADILSNKEKFLKRNVLVGTVRCREQLPVNLSNNFYHIPLSQIISVQDIEYVALYQSKHLFSLETDENGITWYGKIIEATQIKRSEIKEIYSSSNEIYSKFIIDEWKHFALPIEIKGKSPKVFFRTSLFQLLNFGNTCEMFFDRAETLILYLGICDIADGTYDGFNFLKLKVLRHGNKIVVNNGKSKFSYKFKDFKKSPYETTLEIFNKI